MSLNDEEDLVYILMATYNGESYIAGQINSLIAQTHKHWRLVIRDDGSVDKTVQLLQDYQSAYPGKISLVMDDLGNLGSLKNFEVLLQHAGGANYIMFCDQDDYWLEDKIAVTLSKFKEEQDRYGKSSPLLVFTNFHYADPDLAVIPSKATFNVNRIPTIRLAHLLANNPVYGCTMMVNNSLAKLVKNIPAAAENHDYWIALVASAFGHIVYLDKKTILYRQHGANLSGNFNDSTFTNRIKRVLLQKKSLVYANNKIRMAHSLKDTFSASLGSEQTKTIDNFIRFSATKSPALLYKNIKSGVRRQTFMQTVVFYLSLLFVKPSYKNQKNKAFTFFLLSSFLPIFF